MPKAAPEKWKRKKDDVRVLIEEAKIRNNLNESELSRCMGISPSSLTVKKNDPEKMTLKELFSLLELTGKGIRFVEGGSSL